MRRLFVLFAFAAGSTAIATSASAQSDNAQRFATCLAQAYPERVRELLQATSAEAANRPYHLLAEDDRCLGRVFGNQDFSAKDATFTVDMLRGRLAEEELLRQWKQAEALPALPLQQNGYVRPWFAASDRNAEVDAMAVCIADTDPAGIMAVVRSAPGFAAESAAFTALSPAMTKCLAAGTRLNATPQALRAALADALYQRVNNPAPAMPAGGTAR